MTIFIVNLTPENLRKLPSPQYTTNLCLQICKDIFSHYKNVLLKDDQMGQREVECQSNVTEWYLDIFKKYAKIENVVDPIIRVHSIGLSIKANSDAPACQQLIAINNLCEIHPKILLRFLEELIDISLISLTPQVASMPRECFTVCVETLANVSKQLLVHTNKFLDSIKANLNYQQSIEFTSIQISFEPINDKRSEVIHVI